MSRIDRPLAGTTAHGPQVLVSGVAFAGSRGIRRVQLTADGGRTWHDATLVPPLDNPSTWVRWVFQWTPAHPGAYTLGVRATDGTGALQDTGRTPSFPEGATGEHRIELRVA